MAEADQYAHLGANVLVPFRRDGKHDFANDRGIAVVQSSLRTIFGTLCAGPQNQGEVPFNQGLGTLVTLLRHRNINDPTTQELAVYYVADAIRRNEPRVKLKGVELTQSATTRRLVLRLTYDVVSGDEPGSPVIAQDISQEIEL
jgi:phage baseplate assembly protein W